MKKEYIFLLKFYCLILLFLSPLSAMAQNRQVKGTVLSNSGESLIGVSVVIKGSTSGAVTDHDGNFEISALPSDIFVVSYIGFESKELKANNTYLRIVLHEDAILLDNVVVIGYGSVDKSDVTGAVASVKMDALKDIPANSIENLLQGRSAGLQIVNTSQDPGAGVQVRIRGGSSLRGSNSPLLVVDGFPMGDAGNLKQINPADIVSVDVLKDASASSIYGSRGANGVILVTTRKAKKGVTTVNVKHQMTFSQFNSKVMQWNDPALMAQLDNEAKINGGMDPLYIGAVNSSGIYYPSVAEIKDGIWPFYTDWSKQVFRDTPIANITSASVNSASDKTSFNLSASYLSQDGVFIRDDYSKGTVSLNVKHELSNNFSISTINNMSTDKRKANSNLAYWRNPLWPVYNDDGSYFLAGNADYDHPMAWSDLKNDKTKGTDFISSWVFDWQIYKDLNIKSHLNYKYGESVQDRFDPDKYTENGTNNRGAAYINNWKGNDFTTETYMTYKKEFANRHKIDIMVGHSYEYTMGRTSNLESYDFKNGALGNQNMGSGNPEMNRHTNSQTKTKLLSFLGRANYGLDNKYLATFTMRTDGSSKFSENHKWAYFPSAALSWKAHHENFIQYLDIFDELKLRVSYGISGNQGISPYQTLSRYGIENFYNNGQWNTSIGPGYVIGYTGVGGRYKQWGGIPNKDLKWETTSQYNIGLDMAFFNSRLRITADYYDKRTKDLLRERFLPLSSGYDKMWVNDGEIGNKGIEITIEGDIIDTKDWGFSGTFVFSRNRNKVISLGDAVSAGLSTDYLTGIQYEYYGGSVDPFRETSPNILAIGQPVNVFYGYKVDGILQSDKEGAVAGLVGAESKAGEFHYMDLNEDGRFDTNDRTIIGDPNPDFLASLNLSGRYKNFDASIFFNGVFGHDVLWGGMYNSAKYTPLRWTPDNPTDKYPSLRQGRLHYASDWFIKDGTFVRIQNVNVGYNFSSPKIKWLENLRIYLNAENLYTFTGFKGYDPEVGFDGRYGGGYPKLRKFTLGLDITF